MNGFQNVFTFLLKENTQFTGDKKMFHEINFDISNHSFQTALP